MGNLMGEAGLGDKKEEEKKEEEKKEEEDPKEKEKKQGEKKEWEIWRNWNLYMNCLVSLRPICCFIND